MGRGNGVERIDHEGDAAQLRALRLFLGGSLAADEIAIVKRILNR